MQTSGPFLSTATHHSFMDDDAMSAAERRKSYQKNMKAGKGHSLDDSSMASHSTSGMKAAASESQLNESNDSFLSPPKDKRSASKLSLLADKVLGVSVLQRERKRSPLFCLAFELSIMLLWICRPSWPFIPSVALPYCWLHSLVYLYARVCTCIRVGICVCLCIHLCMRVSE